MLVLLFLACRAPTIGMEIVAEAACAATDPEGACGLSFGMNPCRCNVHGFHRDAGVVEVWDERLDDGPAAVVLSIEYAADFDACGDDLVVGDEPIAVRALDGTPLYEVDAAASLAPLPDAPLVEEAGDALTFVYPVESGVVTEVHTVAFREAMDVRPYPGVPCCGTPAAPALPGALLAATLLARRRGAKRAAPPADA